MLLRQQWLSGVLCLIQSLMQPSCAGDLLYRDNFLDCPGQLAVEALHPKLMHVKVRSVDEVLEQHNCFISVDSRTLGLMHYGWRQQLNSCGTLRKIMHDRADIEYSKALICSI